MKAVSAAGLILAAGESRRMGSPKALLRYRGQTFLDTLISLFAARCSPVIVVLGANADEIRRGLSCSAEFVINPDYRTGQTSSMQCGLRAVGARYGGQAIHWAIMHNFLAIEHRGDATGSAARAFLRPRVFLRISMT